MSRLKDVDELITILDEELQKDSSLSKVLLVGFAKQILNDAPAVDAVEVVRCKECKYKGLEDSGWVQCFANNTIFAIDGFCSKGEKKTE